LESEGKHVRNPNLFISDVAKMDRSLLKKLKIYLQLSSCSINEKYRLDALLTYLYNLIAAQIIKRYFLDRLEFRFTVQHLWN